MESAQESRLIDLIKEWFAYDSDRGILIRLKKERTDALDEIPSHWPQVKFKGKSYPYATICWVIYYGKFPSGWVDHKNRIHADHRIDNLREATPRQNQQNKAGTAGTYPKGVTCRFDGSRKKPYQARIRISTGERLLLGSFATVEEAAAAYREAALKYHGEFACLE